MSTVHKTGNHQAIIKTSNITSNYEHPNYLAIMIIEHTLAYLGCKINLLNLFQTRANMKLISDLAISSVC